MVTTLVLTTIQLVRSYRRAFGAVVARPTVEGALGSGDRRVVAAWIGLFVVSIWLLGFVLGAPLAVVLYLLTTARQRLWHALLLAGGAYLFVEIVMVRTLRVVFPPGSLLEWAGLLSGLSSV